MRLECRLVPLSLDLQAHPGRFDLQHAQAAFGDSVHQLENFLQIEYRHRSPLRKLVLQSPPCAPQFEPCPTVVSLTSQDHQDKVVRDHAGQERHILCCSQRELFKVPGVQVGT